MTDAELLRRYAKIQDAQAFGELVDRHGSMVYAVCRRVLGQAVWAEDATQAVFLLLSKRHGKVKGEHVGGWLHRTATFIAREFRRREARRAQREARAAAATAAHRQTATEAEHEVLPALDQALRSLPTSYREPLVLHYLENRSYGDLAAELGLKEEAARQRVSRGVKLLRERLARSGVVVTVALVLSTLEQDAVLAAPVHLLSSVKAAALGGAPVSSLAMQMMEEGVRAMFWNKVQVAAAAVVFGTVLTVGTIYAGGKAETTSKKPAAAKSKTGDGVVQETKPAAADPKEKEALDRRRLELSKEISRLRSKMGQIEHTYLNSDSDVKAALEKSSQAGKERSKAFKTFYEKLKKNKEWQRIEAKRRQLRAGGDAGPDAAGNGGVGEGSKEFMKWTKKSNELYAKLQKKDKVYSRADKRFKDAYAAYKKLLREKALQNEEYAGLDTKYQKLKPEYDAICKKLWGQHGDMRADGAAY